MRYLVLAVLLGVLILLGVVGLPLLSGSAPFPENASPEEVGRFLSGIVGYWRAVFGSTSAPEEIAAPPSPITPEVPSSTPSPTRTPTPTPTPTMTTLSRDTALRALREYVQMIIMPLDLRWKASDRWVYGLEESNSEACLRANRLFDLAYNIPEVSEHFNQAWDALVPLEEGVRFLVDHVIHEDSQTERGLFKVADVRVLEVLPIPVTNFPWVPVRFRYEIRTLTPIGECLALNEYYSGFRVGRIVDSEVLFQLFEDGWRLTNQEQSVGEIPCNKPALHSIFDYTGLDGLYPFCLLDEDGQRGPSLRATQPERFALSTDLQQGQTITLILEPDPWESQEGASIRNLQALLEVSVQILQARLRENPSIAYTTTLEGEKIRLKIKCLAVEGCRMAELLEYVTHGKLEFKKVLRVGSPGELLSSADPSEEILLDRDGVPYLVAREPLLSGSVIRSARVDSTTSPFVRLDLQLTEGGAKRLTELLISGTLSGGNVAGDGLGDRMAIVLDGVVLSAPVVDASLVEAARSQGWQALRESIGIGGFRNSEEAERIAAVINAGPFPIRLRGTLETE